MSGHFLSIDSSGAASSSAPDLVKMSAVRRVFWGIVAAGMLSPPMAVYAAQTHVTKSVAVVHSPDNRDCFFFTLNGVPEADPVAAGSPWFAVPKSHLGFKEIYSLVLTAKVTGLPLNVTTTGTAATACSGHAQVSAVVMP